MSFDHEAPFSSAHDRLRSLYEISTLLAAFESAEETVPKLLDSIRRVLPLQSAILVRDSESPATASTFVWRFRPASREAVEAAAAHAEASFAYLIAPDPASRGIQAGAAPTRRSASSSLRQAGGYVALPLVVSQHPPLGILQLESPSLDELDLHFVSAAVSQLAVALQRRRAEKEREAALVLERRARAEADKANQAKDEFLATLSHELRTPLNAIMGWVGLLKSGILDEAQKARALETIDRSARNQNQLIADILDVQSIVSGQLHLEVGPLVLDDLIQAGIDTLRPTAHAKQVELRTALEPGAEVILGDPHRLRQVMWNLLANAIKFAPRGGWVETRVRSLGPDQVEISVADSGPGIPPNFLPHVFDRFRQADPSARRRNGGLGLGLAIVRHIVELHGGSVEAANQAREVGGAVFSVRLPRVAVVAEGMRAERRRETGAPGLSLAGVRVLVVDDSADDRIVLAHLLEEWGAEVMVAASGEEALRVLVRELPDVLLSDIGMPDEDGYMFLGRVRALPPERGGLTPAVAVTAYFTENDRRRALGAGFQVHLPKPVEPVSLATVVSDLARRAPPR